MTIKESASRLRSGDYPTKDCETVILDAMALAHAYLTEHPADEDEPVTEEWLRTIAHPNPLSTRVYGFTIFACGIQVKVVPHRIREFEFQIELCQDDQNIALGKAKTRGQVRLLCRALGIELKEHL